MTGQHRSEQAAPLARWEPQRVSVVMPSYNRGETLLRVLTAFETQTLPHDRFEVFVVDDGSTDDTLDRLAAYRGRCPYTLTLLQQANRGPAAARNAGLRQAGGDIVIFVDDDCIPTPSLLAEHVASHEVEGLAVIGRITWRPDLPITPFMRYIEADMFAYFNITVPFDAPFACFYTGNASVHRGSALAVGGFDEDFPRAMHEDIDFAYRLRRQGVRIVFNPHALVLHDRTADFLPTLEHQRIKGREIMRFLVKHPELHTLVPLTHFLEPEVRQQFYRAVTLYYFLLGMQDALDEPRYVDANETLPRQFEDERTRWGHRRVEELHAEVQALRRELERLQRTQQWAEHVQHEYARLERAHQELAAWAADLVRRLEARRPLGPLTTLVRRLAGHRHHPRLTGLPALLAARRAVSSLPPPVAQPQATSASAPTAHVDT